MQLPTIHINGTSTETLIEGYEVAGQAIQRAIECLQDAAPNARDYYPAGDEAYALAIREHAARVEKLRAVYADLLIFHEHCSESAEARRR